jgi:hypothetical protein
MFPLDAAARNKPDASREDSACTHHDCGAERQRSASIPALIMAILLSLTVVADEARATGLDSETELAQKTENPISDLMRIPFTNNTNFGIEPNHRTNNELKIQPVIPFRLTRGWNLITRTLLPVIKQPTPSTTNADTWGLGAAQVSAFLSPAQSSTVFAGAGPIFQFPTTTDDVLGSRKWGAGPTASVFVIEGPWTLGLLVNNVWSFAGSRDRPNVNQFFAQQFLNYNFGHGWYLTSSPIVTSNWEGTSGNKWTVPLGGGVGKVFEIGNLTFNATLQAFSNVVHPDPGPDWTLRFQIALLLPRSTD